MSNHITRKFMTVAGIVSVAALAGAGMAGASTTITPEYRRGAAVRQ